MLMPGEELEREDGVQEPSVQGNGGGPVEVLQAAGLLEAGIVQPQFDAPVGRRLTSSLRMISRKEA
jgi:hypothetical protein